MRVHCGFIFNDELDLLEFRLSELDPVVDRFILVEAAETFTGRPKRLIYEEHRDGRFSPWRDKIAHVVANLPGDGNTWQREDAQRRAIRDGLRGAAEDDLVILGDVDEIPYREVVRELAATLTQPTRLGLHYAVYHANAVMPGGLAAGPVLCRVRDLDAPEVLPELGESQQTFTSAKVRREDSGWHFSYLGGEDAILAKVRDFSHVEFNNEVTVGRSHLARCARLSVHFRGDYALRRQSFDELDPMQRRLLEQRPEYFDLRPPPKRLAQLEYRGFSRFRRKLPPAVVAFADRHPVAFHTVAGLPLLLADVATRARITRPPA